MRGLSSDATARITMGVTIKKCHMIMSENECWDCCGSIDTIDFALGINKAESHRTSE